MSTTDEVPGSSLTPELCEAILLCVEFLKSRDVQEVSEALAILGETLAAPEPSVEQQIPALCALLRNSGAIEVLCRHLSHASPAVHTSALLVIGNICAEACDKEGAIDTKARVRAAGGVPLVVRHLSSKSDDTLLYAVGCLMNVVGTMQDAALLNEDPGALPKLVELSTGRDLQLATFAKGVLQNMQVGVRHELKNRRTSQAFAKQLYRAAATAIQAAARGHLVRRQRRRGGGLANSVASVDMDHLSLVQPRLPISTEAGALSPAMLPRALRRMSKDVLVPPPLAALQRGAALAVNSPTGRAMARNFKEVVVPREHNTKPSWPASGGEVKMESDPPAVRSAAATAATAIAMEQGFAAISEEASNALLERPVLQLALLEALEDKQRMAETMAEQAKAEGAALREALAAQAFASTRFEKERDQRLQLERELASLRRVALHNTQATSASATDSIKEEKAPLVSDRASDAAKLVSKPTPALSTGLASNFQQPVIHREPQLARQFKPEQAGTKLNAQQQDATDSCQSVPEPVPVVGLDEPDVPSKSKGLSLPDQRPTPVLPPTDGSPLMDRNVHMMSISKDGTGPAKLATPILGEGGFMSSPLPRRKRPARTSDATEGTASTGVVGSAETMLGIPAPPAIARPVGAPPRGPSRADRLQRNATVSPGEAPAAEPPQSTSGAPVAEPVASGLHVFDVIEERSVDAQSDGAREEMAPPKRSVSFLSS